ncbi:MAG: PIN domain-containing protein [Microbacteriaceae bacterium]|nr:PIN domain-containing protein [Microbacteriaceae bacterium]
MSAPRFVDTNVLLYAVSTAEDEEAKRETARRILRDGDLALSTQVLQEFYVQATRPSRDGALTHEQAGGLIESFTRFPLQETTLGVVLGALDVRRRHGVSYWDAAIIAAASALGCSTLLSEDLADGRDYDGVVVVNPFR